MSAGVRKLAPILSRLIVVRQADATRWRVEAYERLGNRWRFTWLLHPQCGEGAARCHAERLSQSTGLPVGEMLLGERIRLVEGALGKVAA